MRIIFILLESYVLKLRRIDRWLWEDIFIEKNKRKIDKNGVKYNVISEINNNEIYEEQKLSDILAKKLLRIILTSENIENMASNSSKDEL